MPSIPARMCSRWTRARRERTWFRASSPHHRHRRRTRRTLLPQHPRTPPLSCRRRRRTTSATVGARTTPTRGSRSAGCTAAATAASNAASRWERTWFRASSPTHRRRRARRRARGRRRRRIGSAKAGARTTPTRGSRSAGFTVAATAARSAASPAARTPATATIMTLPRPFVVPGTHAGTVLSYLSCGCACVRDVMCRITSVLMRVTVSPVACCCSARALYRVQYALSVLQETNDLRNGKCDQSEMRKNGGEVVL